MMRLPRWWNARLYCVLLTLLLGSAPGCDDEESAATDTSPSDAGPSDMGLELDLTGGDSQDEGDGDVEVESPTIGPTSQTECIDSPIVVGETTQTECVDPGGGDIAVGETTQSSCESSGSPFISPTEQSDCTDAPAVSSVVIDECAGAGEHQPDEIEVVAGPGRIQIVHRNASHNCCGLIEVDLDVDGDLLTLTETERFDEEHPGCFCLCDFTISTEITGLAGSAYTVRLVDASTGEPYGDDLDVTVLAPEPVFDAAGGPGTIALAHLNAEHTCCVDVSMAFGVDGSTVYSWETEQGEPCDCLCLFDLRAEIGGMDAGTYDVQLLTAAGGDPVGDPIEVVVEEADDVIGVEVDQDLLTIHHDNATWNCCGEVEMQVSESDTVILVEEVETYPDGEPCRCVCEYDLSVSASGFAPGDYTVRVFTTDAELGETVFGEVDVTIPGRPVDPIDPLDDISAEPGGAFSIRVFHDNATYNCCSEVAMEAAVVGDTVTVQEVITNDELCHCICNFDLAAQINGVPAGEYTVDVIASDGALAGSDAVIVNGSGDPPPPTESVTFERSGGSITIEHRWVELNCCAEIEMVLDVDGDILDVTETIVDVESLCDCECIFDLGATLEGLDEEADYTLRLWATDGATPLHEEEMNADSINAD